MLDINGKDGFALLESYYGFSLPEDLKAQSMDQAFEAIESNPQYAPLKKQIEDFENANRSPNGGGFLDFTPLIALSTKVYEYLGFCLGKGADAEGNPVKFVDLDKQTPEQPPTA